MLAIAVGGKAFGKIETRRPAGDWRNAMSAAPSLLLSLP
jgi:hypothetical protein